MTLILGHSDIGALLDRHEVRKAVEIAFSGLATGDCHNPAPHALCRLQHLVTADLVIARVRELGIGTDIDLAQ
jgi:hypothetical protein